MTKKFFIHIHIPKCGGSTVQRFLSKNFGRALATTTTLLDTPKLTSREVAEIIMKWPNLRCLTGQRLTLDLPFEDERFDITAFTWIRDPIERFVSTYFYNRHHSYNYLQETKTMSLDDFASWCFLDGGRPDLANVQTRTLVGDSLDLSPVRKHVESGALFLFPLTELRRSIGTLHRRFPEVFRDCRLKSLNVSTKDQEVPKGLNERLRPYFEKDYELLELSGKTPLDPAVETGVWSAILRPWRRNIS